MRKKSKIDEPVEKYSVIRSIRAIDNCDVAIFILDAEDMLTEQDKKIIGYIHEAGKGLILFVNKWDTIEKGNTTNVEFEKEIRKGLPFASYAPVLFGSALTRQAFVFRPLFSMTFSKMPRWSIRRRHIPAA